MQETCAVIPGAIESVCTRLRIPMSRSRLRSWSWLPAQSASADARATSLGSPVSEDVSSGAGTAQIACRWTQRERSKRTNDVKTVAPLQCVIEHWPSVDVGGT